MVGNGAESLLARTRRELEAWRPSRAAQEALRTEYLRFLEAGGVAALQRSAGPEHVTASCFVVTTDRRSVLLAFHRKAQRWLQLGGHLEVGDESSSAAALREAAEEGGVPGLRLASALPADLDRHRLIGRFGSCTTHWDIGYVAFVDVAEPPRVSDESEAVAWWSRTELWDHDPMLARRLDGALAAATGMGVPR